MVMSLIGYGAFTPAAGGGGGSTPLIDQLSSAPIAAYSTRKLRAAYAGSALRVRRYSDLTTQDIGFDINGDLDTAAMATFVGSNNATISKWYDQSGNGNDAEDRNSFNSEEMVLVTAGTNVTQNGKVALLSSNVNFTHIKAYFTLPQPCSFAMVLKPGTFASADDVWLEGRFSDTIDFRTASSTTADIYSGSFLTTTFPWSAGNAFQAHIVLNGGSSSVSKDGGAFTASGNAGSSTPGGVLIGGYGSGGSARNANATYCELLVWNSSITGTDQTTVYTDQKTYWGTP